MRSPFMLVAALGALLVLAAPAAAANDDPVRIWSVSKVMQGAGYTANGPDTEFALLRALP